MTQAAFLILATLLSAATASAAQPTMRVDYYHTGNATEEHFSLDRVVIEPLPWPGNPVAADRRAPTAASTSSRCVDAAGGTVLFSRGFSSIYGEWETTGEAKEMNRTFSESLRFPAPEQPVAIVVKKRDARNVFRDVWTFNARSRPTSSSRAAAGAGRRGRCIKLHESGDPATEARRADSRRRLHRRRARQVRARRPAAGRRRCSRTSPFKERRRDINVWGLCPPARAVGRVAAVAAHLPAVAGRRDLRRVRLRALRADLREQGVSRHRAPNAPYEVVEILVNSATYGGGGIFGLYSTVAADSAWAPYIFVHEFGHHIAGLADEYYTSDVAYLPAADRVEPWEPNATALLDPGDAEMEGPRDAGRRRCRRRGRKRSSRRYTKEIQQRRREIRAANRPEAEMDALFREAAEARHGAARQRAARRARSARSKGRTTRRAATTGRRPTASCSRATTSRSAPSAAARSRRSSTSTRKVESPRHRGLTPIRPPGRVTQGSDTRPTQPDDRVSGSRFLLPPVVRNYDFLVPGSCDLSLSVTPFLYCCLRPLALDLSDRADRAHRRGVVRDTAGGHVSGAEMQVLRSAAARRWRRDHRCAGTIRVDGARSRVVRARNSSGGLRRYSNQHLHPARQRTAARVDRPACRRSTTK